jgi:hypothetical protein
MAAQPEKNGISLTESMLPHTLQDVLEETIFIDYGNLKDYKNLITLDPYANIGVRLIQKLKLHGQPLIPKLQADLLVRYIIEKATQQGENGNTYTATIYHVPHMTRQMALAGYTTNSDRFLAWEKLMKADTARRERQTIRRRIHRL